MKGNTYKGRGKTMKTEEKNIAFKRKVVKRSRNTPQQ